MRHFQILVVATMLLSLSGFAFAQVDYPAKTVRIIVSASPGGGTDITARMYAQKLSENLKRQFVVDNRPGAGDTIGTGLAAKSPPDGYTLMLAGASFTIAPAMYPNFLVDPVKDFAPISLSTKSPLLLVVHPSLPVKTVKQLIALAKAKPGALDMGVVIGGNGHFATAYFASSANIKILLVPYKSSPLTLTDVIAGELPALLGSIVITMPHVESGRLRALAASTAERSSVLPQLPTLAESGLTGYDVSGWYGWVAPIGTPVAIINRLNAELTRATREPDVAKKISAAGSNAISGSPEHFGQLIAAEVARWRAVVKELGLKVE